MNKQCADEQSSLVLGNQMLEVGVIQNLSRPKKVPMTRNTIPRFAREPEAGGSSFTMTPLS